MPFFSDIKSETHPLIPFAFLTHTHQLGIFSGAWRVRDGIWDLIGEENPQNPQSFYPTAYKNMKITKSDILAMRCIMSSNRDQETLQGLSKHSEMCDYFVMYKTKGHILPNNSCTTNSTFTWKSFGLTDKP